MSFSAGMYRFLVALLLVVAACSGSPISPQILGGSDADIADFPYVVSIERYGEHLCGGVIINADWVLTDAWCALQPVEVLDFAVRSGSAILGSGTSHFVNQWFHHPQNDVFNNEFDFALVQVDPPFEFGENVAAVTLPEQEQDTPNGAEALIAGWGSTEVDGDFFSVQLQVANITVLDEASCSGILADQYQFTKLCAQDPNGIATHCFHDEGGALVVDGTAYGIAQWPGFCADPLEVQVYSRIASVRTWIDETIAAGLIL